MILGVDPGYANCGWSVVDPSGRVIALGLITTTQDKTIGKATDKARRMSAVCAVLRDRAQQHRCTTIVAEEAQYHGAPDAVAANLLPWGGVVMLAMSLGAELLEAAPKIWQRAVLGIEPSEKVDYETVETKLAGYVDHQSARDLERIAKKKRNHALDAVGVGVLAAMRPHLTATIVAKRDEVSK